MNKEAIKYANEQASKGLQTFLRWVGKAGLTLGNGYALFSIATYSLPLTAVVVGVEIMCFVWIMDYRYKLEQLNEQEEQLRIHERTGCSREGYRPRQSG